MTHQDDSYATICEQAKQRIIASGKTYPQLAQEIGLPHWLISNVLNGITKAKYGNAHKCAVALGIKQDNVA